MEKKTNYSIQTLLESRSFLYVLLLIVTICFVSTYTKIYDVKLDMNGDNIHYYALGKALAERKNRFQKNNSPLYAIFAESA